jgi:hypothetical protein
MLRVDRMNITNCPHLLVTTGNTVLIDLQNLHRTPPWLICDGGCLHKSSSDALAARSLTKWAIWKSVSVWALRAEPHHELHKYDGLETMTSHLRAHMQRDIMKSYFSVGSARFRLGFTADDFSITTMQSALTNPTDHAPLLSSAKSWTLARTRNCPPEPVTTRLPPSDPQLTGVEMVTPLTPEQTSLRDRDLALWIQSGQHWLDGFLPAARKRVQTYLNDNKQANSAVALSAETWTSNKAAPLAFGKVKDLYVTQAELRPGARGRLWRWDDGVCTEARATTIRTEVSFNVPNIEQACRDIHFQDLRALQMLTETGASDETTEYPLTSIASRNHQGAAHFPASIRKLMKDLLETGNIESSPSGTSCHPHPQHLPFGVLPVNGSEANLKEDQFFNRLNGLEWKPNVRPTFDGSSPHDDEGSSINAHTLLLPELNTPWSTIAQVEESLRVILSTGATVEAFKVDLAKSYFQLHHQHTQRWRQNLYHLWAEGTKIKGGYMTTARLLWGKASAGSVFHRTITTITTKFVEHRLVTKWLPTIQCPLCKAWVNLRRAAGLTGRDLLPAFISAFLDDSCIFAAGTNKDRQLAHKIVMEAFSYLGWTLSAPKLILEGSLSDTIIVLGHGVSCSAQERYVTLHKQLRVTTAINGMTKVQTVPKDDLASLLGLIQSIRGNIVSRFRLSPLYNCLHSRAGSTVILSTRAKKCLFRVLRALPERRSIWQLPPRWDIPSFPLVEGVPNTDASQLYGFAGVLLDGNKLRYFAKPWPPKLASLRANIGPLEAYAVVIAAGIWGNNWRGRNVVFRCDSSDACYALNTLKAKGPLMAYVIDLWEEIQFHHSFNAVVVHCPHGENHIADVASRQPSEPCLETHLLQRFQELHQAANLEVPSITPTREHFRPHIDGIPDDTETVLAHLAAGEGEGVSLHPAL